QLSLHSNNITTLPPTLGGMIALTKCSVDDHVFSDPGSFAAVKSFSRSGAEIVKFPRGRTATDIRLLKKLASRVATAAKAAAAAAKAGPCDDYDLEAVLASFGETPVIVPPKAKGGGASSGAKKKKGPGKKKKR
ncbi:MAG: hypothetical protein VXY99_01590, partial [Pseudomonadota bacterium]|nr:hypothetical protein [Pseudomonadota bacterium]